MEDCGGSGEEFINCIKKHAYSENEIFAPDSGSFKFGRYYHARYTGIIYILELDTGFIGHKYHTSSKLSLNNSIYYAIAMQDPKIHFMSGNPETFPKAHITIQNETAILKVHLKAIRHEKLNLPASPCEDSPVYNVGDCIEKSVMIKAGCQPPWRRVNVEGLPLCDNNETLFKYSSERYVAWEMSRAELFQKTKCLMPCSFMEFKVNSASAIILPNVKLFFSGDRKSRQIWWQFQFHEFCASICEQQCPSSEGGRSLLIW